VTVQSGQTASPSNLRAQKGSLLRVRLNDPAQKYVAATAANPTTVTVGILTPASILHILPQAVTDGTGRTVDVAIPFDTQVRVMVDAGKLQLADSQGAALAAGPTVVSVQHASGKSNSGVEFTVTGKRP